ncbi:very short patch repair endonuclease [Microbispora sp. NPDC049125]|uniref:very short patch repair endonuclease n=1 Tax=Microbispora sp. NPDC049125 TaxID=3154929 RepID=UPI003467824D
MNRARDTSPGIALRKAAHALGLRCRVSARPLPSLRRTADMVFTRAKVAVFVDGCFWHRCPLHYSAAATNPEYWVEKVRRTCERDVETNRLLTLAGWLSIRVWEHEDAREAAAKVAREVTNRRSQGLAATTRRRNE